MDQTYDKKTVLAAANATAQDMRAKRKEALATWDSCTVLYRFFSTFLALGRREIKSSGLGRQKIAERISFKATVCIEDAVYLTDNEIDAIRDYWGTEQQ
jgi:hypothetical protein